MKADFNTNDSDGRFVQHWRVYACNGCGGVVTACADHASARVRQYFPQVAEIDEALPERARSYLKQAVQSISAPAGAVMLAASAVDAMLKEKSYVKGSLYARIDQAAKDHLITDEMAKWAHEVRLDANDQRHSDTDAELPTTADAQRSISFTKALGEFLFVLPARVNRGRDAAKPVAPSSKTGT